MQKLAVDTVASALSASGLDARYLELELTERTVMNDAEQNLGTLSALNDMGIELAIDDFGTGYSSLAYLKRFPVSTLKIDRSFVIDIPADPNDVAIVTAITSMAHGLNIDVIAEGVENETQRRFLAELNCRCCQGYYFSRPQPAASLETLLAQGILPAVSRA